jgi:hypothetical protein
MDAIGSPPLWPEAPATTTDAVSGLHPTCRGREQSAIAASALRIARAEDRASQDSDGNDFRCQFCVVEVERFKLADGTLRSFASRAT